MWVKGCSACGNDHDKVEHQAGCFVCPSTGKKVHYYEIGEQNKRSGIVKKPDAMGFVERLKSEALVSPYLIERSLTLKARTSKNAEVMRDITLPEFGEVKIITHGKDIRIETTVKEKVE